MADDKWTKRNGYLSLAGIKFWRADWDTAIRYVAGDGVHSASTGSAYICILEHTADAAKEPGVGVDWQLYWNVLVEGGNGNVFIDVTQTGHGLVIGDYVRQDTANPNSYVPAVASSFLNSQGIGFVVDVPDADHFVLVQTGYVINALGAVPSFPEGTALYLSPTTPGGVTSTKPSTVGQYIKPVAIITEDGVSMWVLSDFPTAVPTGGGGGVQSVTDDGKGIVNVNNTDVQNPVVEFDEVALANYVPFIDALVGNSYFTTELANDANFITELTNNANFQTNVNTFVNGGGVSSGFSLPSYRYEVQGGPSLGNASFPSQQIVRFGDYIFFGETNTNPASFTFPRSYRVYKLDSVTGEPYVISSPFVQNPYSGDYSMCLYSSYDETLLYHVYYNSGLSGPGPVFNITMKVDVYDPTMTLVTSYTGTVGTNSSTSGLRSAFVIGTTLYVSNGSNVDTFTLSAGSITAGASAGATNFRQATYDGTNLWTISSSGTTFGKYTVSGTTITPVAATFKYPTASGSLGLYTGCDIGYGIYIGNGKFGIWSPDTIGIKGSTGGGPSYVVAQEDAACTLREYPLP